jgi:transcriptional regulator with XRE-family HTH domain
MKTTPFARRLRELREAAGLTQVQLAQAAGLHRQGIAKLEGGERAPAWDTVQKLAAALGVDCTAFQDTPAGDPEAPPRGRRRKKGT